jgi:hypothetical protein
MESERVEKPCPFCAELVLVAASKCRFCGSVIARNEAFNKQTPDAPGRIRLSRESQFTAVARAFRVSIDGTFVGTMASGDDIEVDVSPGSHEVTVELTTIGTMRGCLTVHSIAGETRHLKASIKSGLWKNELVLKAIT